MQAGKTSTAHLAVAVSQPAACLLGGQRRSSTQAVQRALLPAAGPAKWLRLLPAAALLAAPGGAARHGPAHQAVGGLLHGCGGLALIRLLPQLTALLL
jgi:hypothetical protein